MRRILFAVFLTIALATSASAVDLRLCTAALVTEGLCPDTTKDILSLVGEPSDMDDLVSALSSLAEWTATVTCNDFWVSEGECTNGQRGDPITNPVTEEEAALEFYRQIVISAIVEWRIREAEFTAANLVDTDPDIE